MKIGTKIRKLRELKDYNQAYMAHELNISQSQYARIESNQADISFSRLQKVSELLEVDLGLLLKFDVESLLQPEMRGGGKKRKRSLRRTQK